MRLRTSLAPLLLAVLLPSPGLAQLQEEEIAAADAMGLALFGNSVAIEGSTAVIGARGDNPDGRFIGAAYVFDAGTRGWRQSQKLLPSPAFFGMRFGACVGMSGDWVAVGADAENNFAGTVYIFQRQGSSFVQRQKLQASDPSQQAHFGQALALWQDRLIVGAHQKSTTFFGDGAAYVFELQGSTWVQVAKLTASDPGQADVFGLSVAIHGDVALVGAPYSDGPPVDSGGAYVFERGPSGWVQTQKLMPLQGQASQLAGVGVAAGQDWLFVGAPHFDGAFNNQGRIYVFQRSGATWVETQTLLASDPGSVLRLGDVMAVEGDRLLAGTSSDKDHGTNSGSAYLFRRVGSSWQQSGKLLAGNGVVGDTFGDSIALSGDTAIVGAKATDGACPSSETCNSGSAYIFSLGTDSVQYCSCPAPAGPCGNPDDHGGCRNSVGHGAVLAACGSGSVALDDLVLRCQWMPPNQPALLFMGGTTASNPLGDGQLCVFPGPTGIHRFPAAFSTGQGSIQHGPGLVGLSQAFTPPGPIQPGEDRHFQVWFRDPAGPCGSVTNLSNAVRVTFRP